MSKTDQWINRTEIHSESSDRIYVVSQHATKRFWACSCPAWRTRRRCKHLDQLGLPGGEQPFEVGKDHAMKKGFLEGYRTYDTSEGHGSREQWQQALVKRLGLDEARRTLGLAADAGWDEVRQAFHLAATESMTRLVGEYEAAVRAFDGTGPLEEKAEVVKAARFRLEAYTAYLAEQQTRLQQEGERITGLLLQRIEAL